MDAELLAAGVGPGHPSLYESPDVDGDLREDTDRPSHRH
jgi:hypothetical protein